jgi:hypothetical protein
VTPSTASENKVGGLRGRASVVAHAGFFEVLRVLCTTPTAEQELRVQQAVDYLAELIGRDDTDGFLARGNIVHPETIITSFVPSLFTRVLPPCDYPNTTMMWTGQQPSTVTLRGYLDTGLVCDTTIAGVRGIFPFGFLEFARVDNSKNKRAQQLVYALHLLKAFPPNTVACLLGCLVTFGESGMMDVIVRGYCPQVDARLDEADNTVPIAEVELFNSVKCHTDPRNALSRAIKALINNATNLGFHTRPLLPNSQQIKVARNGDKVFKEYRTFDNPREVACKRPDRNLEFLPNCKKFADFPGFLVVLEYDYIEGTHEMTTMGQCAALVQALDTLHTRHHLCHGDVRTRNIVFELGNTARFIDYDLCAPTGWRYTPHYNTAIDDGARHVDAKAGSLLAPAHDWFSLAAVFRLFAPVDSAHDDLWARIVGAVEKADHTTAVSLITQGRDVKMGRVPTAAWRSTLAQDRCWRPHPSPVAP